MKGAEPERVNLLSENSLDSATWDFHAVFVFLSLLFVSIFDQTTMAQAQK